MPVPLLRVECLMVWHMSPGKWFVCIGVGVSVENVRCETGCVYRFSTFWMLLLLISVIEIAKGS